MRYIVSFIILIFLSSCLKLNFKSDYQEVEYYSIKQQELNSSNAQKTDQNIMIRNFTISSEYDTEYLIEKDNNSQIELYHYHRWMDLPAPVVTDFVTERFIRSDKFNSVLRTGSFVIPDLVMEGHINHINGIKEDRESYAEASITINVLDNKGKHLIFTKTYLRKTIREKGKAADLALGLSKVISEITDEIIVDVSKLSGK